ncbi:uncharacterized protein LOC135941661 [Cloeon dipterum]|uniref:uncharacterized protein LOC135941661 n=1 Tax=Cloeon dipterum TaxID=197152 RepID=UPI0032200B34
MISACSVIILALSVLPSTRPAIVAPPWAHPNANPCGDWQEVRWNGDGRCYRIFQQGPCPETLELAFRTDKGEAECQCPPRTAQWARDAKCHKLYQRGPCLLGRYFAPVVNTRWGTCLDPERECEEGQLYWPKDGGKCYQRLTRGPCPIGELLVEEEEESPMGVCRCDSREELHSFRWSTNSDACYEPFSRGPCSRGELVLPSPPRCGCSADLPQFYNESKECHELGTTGPCPPGHEFVQRNSNNEWAPAQCQCKKLHIFWPETGACYREYTRGPCQSGSMVLPPTPPMTNRTQCVSLPCARGHLYLPEARGCFRAGSRGPCPFGSLVVFEDYLGVSYKGRCGCSAKDFPSQAWDSGNQCFEVGVQGPCPKGHVFGPGGMCHTLYTKGFCQSGGEWLVPHGEGGAKCECRPGYGPVADDPSDPCQPPLVALARFLSSGFK